MLGRELNVVWLLRALGYHVDPRAVFRGYAIHSTAEVASGATIAGGVRLGPDVKVGERSVIRPGAILSHSVRIGDHCVVGEGARLANISVGDGTMIEFEVLCLGHGHGHIEIGRNSYIGIRNVLDWSDSITIGDFVHIAGPSTAIWTHSSVYQAIHGDPLENKTRRTTAPVRIGNNIYVGGNCTIYPGVTIGDGSVILPNSAVPEDVPCGVMAGGVPARIINMTLDHQG